MVSDGDNVEQQRQSRADKSSELADVVVFRSFAVSSAWLEVAQTFTRRLGTLTRTRRACPDNAFIFHFRPHFSSLPLGWSAFTAATYSTVRRHWRHHLRAHVIISMHTDGQSQFTWASHTVLSGDAGDRGDVDLATSCYTSIPGAVDRLPSESRLRKLTPKTNSSWKRLVPPGTGIIHTAQPVCCSLHKPKLEDSRRQTPNAKRQRH